MRLATTNICITNNSRILFRRDAKDQKDYNQQEVDNERYLIDYMTLGQSLVYNVVVPRMNDFNLFYDMLI